MPEIKARSLTGFIPVATHLPGDHPQPHSSRSERESIVAKDKLPECLSALKSALFMVIPATNIAIRISHGLLCA